MSLSNFVSGKIPLNHYVHRLVQNEASFHVHYWGCMPNHYNNLLHKHAFFEVCYVVDGKGYYKENSLAYPLKANTMFISRPNTLHQIESDDGLFLLYVAFELIESDSSDEWKKIIADAKQCSQVIVHLEEDSVAPLLWKSLLIQATKPEHVFFEENLKNLSFSLIYSLLQKFVPFSNKSNQKNLTVKSSPILHQVKLHIRDNLSDSLKLTDIASHFHVSGRHLSRIFVTELGQSYSDFVQNERIQKAATLLKTTDLSIKHIAEKCGFTTVHYFTRVFTDIMCNPPGRFRSLYTNLKTTTFTDY